MLETEHSISEMQKTASGGSAACDRSERTLRQQSVPTGEGQATAGRNRARAHARKRATDHTDDTWLAILHMVVRWIGSS